MLVLDKIASGFMRELHFVGYVFPIFITEEMVCDEITFGCGSRLHLDWRNVQLCVIMCETKGTS